MHDHSTVKLTLCGIAAGAINGLLGTGGGMILVPLLTRFVQIREEQTFPASVSIILPICAVSILTYGNQLTENFPAALPFLVGGVIGGILAGLTGKKIPVTWLHRGLGVLILWCGIRRLWQTP